MCSYYLWGHIQDPFTLYNEIKSLDKGSIKIIDVNGNEKNIKYCSIKKELLNSNNNQINEVDALDYLKDSLDNSLKYHQIADVPITLLLSSGIDSNVLLAKILEKKNKNLNLLTLDFEPKKNKNETIIAEKSAKMYELHHSSKKFENYEIKEMSKLFFNQMDSPTSDGLNNFLISSEVKKNGGKVSISGVGADEFFFWISKF